MATYTLNKAIIHTLSTRSAIPFESIKEHNAIEDRLPFQATPPLTQNLFAAIAARPLVRILSYLSPAPLPIQDPRIITLITPSISPYQGPRILRRKT